MAKLHVTYEEIHNLVKKSAEDLKQIYEPDLIVAISGGGLIPSRILRTFIKAPILVIGISLYDEQDNPQKTIKKTQWFDNPQRIKGKRILIMDEVDDTRLTLQFVTEELRQLEPADMCVCVMHNKDKQKRGVIAPDTKYYAARTVPDQWLVYPWDNPDFLDEKPKTSHTNQHPSNLEDKVIIIDFGSQYTQLIARRVRELNVYSEVVPFDTWSTSKWKNEKGQIYEELKAIILSGSPYSVNGSEPDISPRLPGLKEMVDSNIPILGICYGAQLLTKELNLGQVVSSKHREYGHCDLVMLRDNLLFKDVDKSLLHVWMSHGDSIVSLDLSQVELLAQTLNQHNSVAATFKLINKPVYGLQFHPEVVHTKCGALLLRNFLVQVAQCKQTWTAKHFVEEMESRLQVYAQEHVVLALSGGVDSTVAAMVLKRVVGEKLHCIFVDNGLLRKGEFQQVLETYKNLGLNVKGVDASQQFYDSLKGLTDPELKRKAIGKTFIDVFEKEAKQLSNVNYLAQGTIYPDVIESIAHKAKTIKSHHNVGGLPEKLHLKLIEPLRSLFKDEVRRVGHELGVPDSIIQRHPFPGPGLAIRILGEVTPERVSIAQQADHIFIQNLKDKGFYESIWQAGVILLNCQSVGVMGDERTFENVVALRAVTSVDGMTADWAKLDWAFLGHVSNEIINKVKEVNRVVYDISSKPPATIEWE